MENPNFHIKLLSKSELAERLGCSEGSVQRLYQRHKIPFIRVGGLIKFDGDEVVAHLKTASTSEGV